MSHKVYRAMREQVKLDRLYEYRRKLPHYQKADGIHFVTFCKLLKDPFPPEARQVVLQHCSHDQGIRYQLHAAVVMPDHVHLLLTPLRDIEGWPFALPAILILIKGASARSVNKLLGCHGPVWQEESFDPRLALRREPTTQERVHPAKFRATRTSGRAEDYRWLWLE